MAHLKHLKIVTGLLFLGAMASTSFSQKVEIYKIEFTSTAQNKDEFESLIRTDNPDMNFFLGSANVKFSAGSDKQAEDVESIRIMELINSEELVVSNFFETVEEQFKFNNETWRDTAHMSRELQFGTIHPLGITAQNNKIVVQNAYAQASIDLLDHLKTYLNAKSINRFNELKYHLTVPKYVLSTLPLDIRKNIYEKALNEFNPEENLHSVEMLNEMQNVSGAQTIYFDAYHDEQNAQYEISVYYYYMNYPKLVTKYRILMDETAWNGILQELQ